MAETKRQNISKVVMDRICCGCGTCSYVCPTRCISMSIDECSFILPSVNIDACIHCGRCLNVCPMWYACTETSVRTGI